LEQLAKDIRKAIREISQYFVPHFRQFLRFLLLPYCYLFLVNWKECTASRLQVAKDLLYIFFVLRNFPDNYSPCRFYELPRSEWTYYYGSSYNPFQRGNLIRVVQPQEYQIVFEDKEVCQKLCEGHGLPVPECVGFVQPGQSFMSQVDTTLAQYEVGEFFSKPVAGSAGQGVYLLRKHNGCVEVNGQKGTVDAGNDSFIKERYLVQKRVRQHHEMARVNPASTNTVRVLTFMGKDNQSFAFNASLRLGVGESPIDNWSAGGIGTGVNIENGQVTTAGLDKKGVKHSMHPNTKITFEGFQIPQWEQVLSLAEKTQNCFPFYRLLGLDIVISENGPVLIEINAFPDLVFAEQKAEPFLKKKRLYEEFKNYDLLINQKQKDLYRNG